MHNMEKGKWYEIRHRNPLQRFDRKSVMQYLGVDEKMLRPAYVVHLFNARPVAGMQSLMDTDIISVQERPPQQPYVNARWP